jgi:hypothetical protein
MEIQFSYERPSENWRWLAVVEEKKLEVYCNGSSRVYTLPDNPVKFEQNEEYVDMYFPNGKYLQLKFEENAFLTGDVFDPDGWHDYVFACHQF